MQFEVGNGCTKLSYIPICVAMQSGRSIKVKFLIFQTKLKFNITGNHLGKRSVVEILLISDIMIKRVDAVY